MKHFSSALLCGVALGVLPVAAISPASAQTTTTDQSGDTASTGGDIVVTGIRGSMKKSIDIKRNSINVVDSIDSEDIGKLPDQNVAESLQRIPGVTIDRNRGDGQFVSVDGLGPQFNMVTLNGRTLATENVGREFSFDVLPSELISGADVYKSPTANINGASIGATINIRTVRPLDQKPFVLAGTLQAEREVLGSSWAPQASAVVSWHNADSTFGASLVGSYSKRKIRVDEFDIGAGWVQHSSDDSYYNGRVGPGVAPFTDLWMPSNMSPTYDFDEKKRVGLDGTIQWKPTENLAMTLDAFYAHLYDLDRQTQVAYDFSGGTLVDQVVADGAAQYQKFEGGFVDEIQTRAPLTSNTYLFGYNIAWTKGAFKLIGDASYSQATLTGNNDTYFSTIRHTGMTSEWDRRSGSPIFDMDWSNPNYPNGPTDVDNVGAHYEDDGGTNRKDQALNLKLDGVWDPGGPVKAYIGYAYEVRRKTATKIDQTGASQCAFCGGTIYEPLPSSLFHLTPDDWFSTYNGDTVRQWIAYDPRDLVAALKAYQGAPGFVGYQGPVPNPAGSSVVEEHDNIGYLMFDIDSTLGSLPFSLNAGVRVEDTGFTSNGAAQTVISAKPNGQGQNIIVLSPVVPIGFRGHYTDILPSMNAKLSLTHDLLLRFAASRVMTRPTLSDLSPAQGILTNPGNEQITHGNPDLKPFRATQIQAGLEWYFDRYSLLSGQVFYKNIDSFVALTTTPQQVDEITFQVTEPTNGKGASVKGAELGYRQVFAHLPGVLSGLGAQASGTYVESDANYANQVTGTHYGLEGLSKWSYSLVGFYEKYGIQARLAYTWRSKFLQQANGRNGLPLYFASYGQLDASLSYDLTPNITLTADALNVTDANEFTYSVIPGQTFSYRRTGPRYQAGIRVRL